MNPQEPERKIIFNAPPKDPALATKEEAKKQAVPNMRSFAYDIESTVAHNDISMAQMVLAEDRKRQEAHLTAEDVLERKKSISLFKVTLITLGIIAILGGGGAVMFALQARTPVATNQVSAIPVSPFVHVNNEEEVTLQDSLKGGLLASIANLKKRDIPLGQLLGVKFTLGGDSGVERLSSGQFLSALESRVPETLTRDLDQRFSFGLYSLRGNEPYLILKTGNFDNAYAGMLEWEATLSDDAGPLFFTRDQLTVATTTEANPQKSPFADKVIANLDTRAILDPSGKVLMLWSIVNRTYIVIAGSPDALEEIVSRMTTQSIER